MQSPLCRESPSQGEQLPPKLLSSPSRGEQSPPKVNSDLSSSRLTWAPHQPPTMAAAAVIDYRRNDITDCCRAGLRRFRRRAGRADARLYLAAPTTRSSCRDRVSNHVPWDRRVYTHSGERSHNSIHERTTVNRQRFPGNKLRLLGDQKRYGFSCILRNGQSSKWRRRDVIFYNVRCTPIIEHRLP